MRVGLLADRLNRGARQTGVGAYIDGLVHGIEDVATPPDEFVLFSWGTEGETSANGPVERSMLDWPRRATAASWTLFGRPRVRRVGRPIDLLHVLVPTVPVPSSAPVVATVHDLMPFKHPRLYHPRQRLLFVETLRRIRRTARWVITVSEATKRDVVDVLGFPADRVTVVHLAVPVHFDTAPEHVPQATREQLAVGDGPLAVFVGAIGTRKNVRLLVEAFAHVTASIPEAQLVLVGSPAIGSSEVDAAIDRLGLGASVHRLGHAPQPLVDALVAAADVLVLPSLDEGFGIPALEAMSVGTAVVTSDAGSLPEVVGDAGLVVPVGDVDALADAIGRVLADAGLRRSLVERGRHRAETFSWENAATKTIEVYEHALS